jgi:hypothetical protein
MRVVRIEECAMSDLHNNLYENPNVRRDIQLEFRPISVWAGLAALVIVVGIFLALDMFAGPNTQMATNTPISETIGSRGPAPPALPAEKR